MNETGATEKKFYTAAELAKQTGLALNTIYAGLRNGAIPSIKVGDRWLIPCKAWDAKQG